MKYLKLLSLALLTICLTFCSEEGDTSNVNSINLDTLSVSSTSIELQWGEQAATTALFYTVEESNEIVTSMFVETSQVEVTVDGLIPNTVYTVSFYIIDATTLTQLMFGDLDALDGAVVAATMDITTNEAPAIDAADIPAVYYATSSSYYYVLEEGGKGYYGLTPITADNERDQASEETITWEVVSSLEDIPSTAGIRITSNDGSYLEFEVITEDGKITYIKDTFNKTKYGRVEE